MQILYFSSLYAGYKLLERPLDAVIKCMANPINNIFSRDDVPLWAFYSPIKSPALAKDGFPSGCADNMQQMHALQIDYDGELPIADFCEQFKHTYFLLYTSYRSTPQKEKYRVILPLKEPINNGLLRCANNKRLVAGYFPNSDLSTINSFRKQRIPALDPRNPSYYQFIVNQGEPFALPEHKMVANYIAERDRLDTRSYADDSLPDHYYSIRGLYLPRNDYHAKLIEDISAELNSLPYGSRGNGIVHNGLLRCWGRLIGCGVESQKAADIMLACTPANIKSEVMAIIRWKN